jgi:hypothetical protein
MRPATYNLPTGYRGDSYGPITFRFNNGSGNSINLDGYSGGLQVRQAQDLPVVAQWITADNSMQISGNTVTLSLRSGSCMRMMPGNYYYDMQLNSGSISKTYIKGVLPIEGDITQI